MDISAVGQVNFVSRSIFSGNETQNESRPAQGADPAGPINEGVSPEAQTSPLPPVPAPGPLGEESPNVTGPRSHSPGHTIDLRV